MSFPSQYLKYVFIVVAVLIAIGSLIVSDSLIKKLAQEERQKMEIWSEAMRIMTMDNPVSDNTGMDSDISLVLKVLESNTTIPTILSDGDGNIFANRNVAIPEKVDENAFLQQKIKEYASRKAPIVIDLGDTVQYLYYDDSLILKRLEMFPYIQLSVVFVFILIAFLALMSTKKAEQNKVWVGLSKETAHQLGTPISSLIAWVEYLKTKEVDADYLFEMEKDVKRLEIIADRFSKIGSNPNLQPINLNEALLTACGYMESRISTKVKMTVKPADGTIHVLMNDALFSWVIENLTKNAADAMDGKGQITFIAGEKGNKGWIDVIDTGKGIHKSKFKTIFNPGYTTKTRGWGLGLSLVKRIIESYPGGKIYVKHSEAGKGATFRIELRKVR
ncbi:MAG: HAMP domain-containing histidine kinase [Tannerella sp.]|jgi:signal transduction histidine kinase|nr:HAMP domain-containing histidine kinase [Tannerella sp.]